MDELVGTAFLFSLIWIFVANHSIFFCCKKKIASKSNTTPQSKGNAKTPGTPDAQTPKVNIKADTKAGTKAGNKVGKVKTAMSVAEGEVSEPDLMSDCQLKEGEIGSKVFEEKTCEGNTLQSLQSREVIKSVVYDNNRNVNPHQKGVRTKTVDAPTDLRSVI